MKSLQDVMLNPIRMRIVQVVAAQASTTTAEICKHISDVPRTTLYRHINVLLKANVLAVTGEKKIRGSTERTLVLNRAEIGKQNTARDVPKQAFNFLMATYAKFEQYFKKAGAQAPGAGKIFFNNTVMMMSDEEFDRFLSELHALLVKYHCGTAKERKPRDISIISSPVVTENENTP